MSIWIQFLSILDFLGFSPLFCFLVVSFTAHYGVWTALISNYYLWIEFTVTNTFVWFFSLCISYSVLLFIASLFWVLWFSDISHGLTKVFAFSSSIGSAFHKCPIHHLWTKSPLNSSASPSLVFSWWYLLVLVLSAPHFAIFRAFCLYSCLPLCSDTSVFTVQIYQSISFTYYLPQKINLHLVWRFPLGKSVVEEIEFKHWFWSIGTVCWLFFVFNLFLWVREVFAW